MQWIRYANGSHMIEYADGCYECAAVVESYHVPRFIDFKLFKWPLPSPTLWRSRSTMTRKPGPGVPGALKVRKADGFTTWYDARHAALMALTVLLNEDIQRLEEMKQEHKRGAAECDDALRGLGEAAAARAARDMDGGAA